jgi:uncharacterized membrane protein
VTFEAESRIAALCFADSALQVVCIPKCVVVLGTKCFAQSKLENVTFETGSRLATIKSGSLNAAC